ncbi:uncharacterized protein MELLADRAFT_111438 [Melampsora larici-populina 98AG31]|uniref:Uncharacterized protein n=1 Tax=Melampsora larici-populina (strain 98AG31 / pathotype 3-4-7) TaxID=747676 RepID=F4S372_MELLP|nr:uncharacterized protein MELLADRAFT_111438 [Melampsora larici-populina 98AG31]EGG00931.1 hypothetical protein MELLADRAFT_111438 [Melampsora larici-populina 98AG31]
MASAQTPSIRWQNALQPTPDGSQLMPRFQHLTTPGPQIINTSRTPADADSQNSLNNLGHPEATWQVVGAETSGPVNGGSPNANDGNGGNLMKSTPKVGKMAIIGAGKDRTRIAGWFLSPMFSN